LLNQSAAQPICDVREEITTLRLVSPSHDDGALCARYAYESTSNRLDPGFVADELAVLQRYLKTESQATNLQ